MRGETDQMAPFKRARMIQKPLVPLWKCLKQLYQSDFQGPEPEEFFPINHNSDTCFWNCPFCTTNGLIWNFEASWFLIQTMFYTFNDPLFVSLFFLNTPFPLNQIISYFDNKNFMLFTFIAYSVPSQEERC